MIRRDNKNNKKMVKNFNGKEMVFGTSKEFLDLVHTLDTIQDSFEKGFLSFHCETKEDIEYVCSMIEEHNDQRLVNLKINHIRGANANDLMEQGLPVYLSVETDKMKSDFVSTSKDVNTPFSFEVKDFKSEKEFYQSVTFNELAELPFDDNEKI